MRRHMLSQRKVLKCWLDRVSQPPWRFALVGICLFALLQAQACNHTNPPAATTTLTLIDQSWVDKDTRGRLTRKRQSRSFLRAATTNGLDFRFRQSNTSDHTRIAQFSEDFPKVRILDVDLR